MEPEVTALGQETEAPPAAPENPLLGEGTPAPQDAASEDTPTPESTEPEAETPDDAELFGRDNFKSHRETLRENALAEGRLEAQGELAPLLEGAGQEYTKLTRQAGSLLGRLNRAANDGALDANGVASLVAEHGGFFDALSKAVDTELPQREGRIAYGNFLTAIAQDMNDFQLVADFNKRLPFALAGKDTKFIPDLRKRIVGDLEEAGSYEKGKQAGLREGKAAKAAQQPAGPGAGVLAPGSSAGKLPMSYEAYMNRTPEQDAAMSEADHRQMFQEGVRRQVQPK